jgi:hypothetical protein
MAGAAGWKRAMRGDMQKASMNEAFAPR